MTLWQRFLARFLAPTPHGMIREGLSKKSGLNGPPDAYRPPPPAFGSSILPRTSLNIPMPPGAKPPKRSDPPERYMA